MEKKLIIVHPHGVYDTTHKILPRIIQLAQQFDAQDRIALIHPKYKSYIPDIEVGKQLSSWLGEMTDDALLEKLIEKEVTITGHTANLCHRSAYMAVIRTQRRCGKRVSIRLHTETIAAYKCNDDGTSVSDTIESMHDADSEWLDSLGALLNPRSLEPRQKRTLLRMMEYVRPVMSDSSELSIDGQWLYRNPNAAITLSIQN